VSLIAGLEMNRNGGVDYGMGYGIFFEIATNFSIAISGSVV